MRIPVTVSKDEIVETLKKKAAEYGFRYEEHDYLRSIYTPLESELIKTLMAAYQEVTHDYESQPQTSGGATYARAIDNCVAFGAVLPGKAKTEHQPNEYIVLDDMKIAMEIYMSAFEKLQEVAK
jgi:acetylornithine deacetylase/succinyl-diaminopimelate desuccinylase-like protein